MFTVLLNCLSAGLTLWDDKEKTKYVDQVISLKEQYYAEFNKPLDSRSDAVLDNLEFQLRVLATSFASSVGKPDTAPKP